MRARFHKHRQQEINALSATMAMGWTALLNGFGGSDSAKITPQDLLPFDFSKSNGGNGKVSGKTKEIIEQLLQSEALQPVMASAFARLIDDRANIPNKESEYTKAPQWLADFYSKHNQNP